MDRADSPDTFRRLIYASTAIDADFLAILRESQTNNGVDGISGLLTFDGLGFIQVLEGPPESVTDTFERIKSDARHADIHVISDTMESERVFGGWTMAGIPGEREDVLRDRLGAMLRTAPAAVRDVFAKVR